MNDLIFDNFQDEVNQSLLRHKSILDIITKYNESNCRISRSVIKSVTNCGCIKICANKQTILNEFDSNTISNQDLSTHLKGQLCDECRDIVENEIGNSLFYLTSLCNVLDLNLYDILLKETDKINTLGKFNLR